MNVREFVPDFDVSSGGAGDDHRQAPPPAREAEATVQSQLVAEATHAAVAAPAGAAERPGAEVVEAPPSPRGDRDPAAPAPLPPAAEEAQPPAAGGDQGQGAAGQAAAPPRRQRKIKAAAPPVENPVADASAYLLKAESLVDIRKVVFDVGGVEG